LQAVTKMLSGNGTGNNIALGASAMTQQNTGLGATISQSISGALAPLGAMK